MAVFDVVVGGVLAIAGGAVTQLAGFYFQGLQQARIWARDDRSYRALVRGSLESVFIYSSEAAARAAFDGTKWNRSVERLTALLTPEVMRALTPEQGETFTRAAFEVELAFNHIVQIAGPSGLVNQFRDLDRELQDPDDKLSAEMKVISDVRYTAEPARDAVVNALKVLGVLKPIMDESPVREVVNEFRRLRGVAPW